VHCQLLLARSGRSGAQPNATSKPPMAAAIFCRFHFVASHACASAELFVRMLMIAMLSIGR
jgi:hypothetical protein